MPCGPVVSQRRHCCWAALAAGSSTGYEPRHDAGVGDRGWHGGTQARRPIRSVLIWTSLSARVGPRGRVGSGGARVPSTRVLPALRALKPNPAGPHTRARSRALMTSTLNCARARTQSRMHACMRSHRLMGARVHLHAFAHTRAHTATATAESSSAIGRED